MIDVGTIVGHRYRIEELIGSGGMAMVYRAVNLSNRRMVALKVLKDEYLNDAEFLRRFEREAKAVLHLSHDNIVHAYGVGEYDGLPYIVLEYVSGQTLKQIITENGPMPARLAVSFATQVLDALTCAHRAGIIHRDVKPQNVIITPRGVAKLTDFGIARDLSANTLTFDGSTILGSVHYLSPEQAMGKPVTEGSDLYSVGVMLYEMLTGRVPFDSENTVAVAMMHVHDEPVPPIKLNTKIPPALNDVVMRAMNKKLGERYATALEMSRHLERALREPNGSFAREYRPEAPILSAPTKKKKIKRDRGPLKIGIAVAAVVAVVIGVFLVLRQSYQMDSSKLEVVPTLTDRTLKEAQTKAVNYGFSLEIEEYEASETVSYGCIIIQSPEPGVKAKQGSAISVIVSLGATSPKMPDLSGMTLDEATATLASMGLELGSMDYQVSDVSLGCVCWQSVTPGEEVKVGEIVDIRIAANGQDSMLMPDSIGELFRIVLTDLAEMNIENIYVRYDPTSREEDGTVLSQSPEPGTPIIPEAVVSLTIAGSQEYAYYADVAFNVTIEENDTPMFVAVMETFNGCAYYRVLYEATLQKGERQPVSFTAYSEIDGTRELLLYVNGKDVKRQDAAFLPRES